MSASSTTQQPAIVPRWEWRTFGTRFGDAEEAFAAMSPQGVKESEELYFLSPRGANVKVRDDLLDIKVLEEVGADSLERWMPVMKTAFPLSASSVEEVFAAMQVPAPKLERDSYTLEQLVSELVESVPEVRVVPVSKRRVRYSIGGCAAEVSEVAANGNPVRTIAIESEDPAAVVAAVREVGLDDYVNTNYPRGLRALIDEEPTRYAVIDVGTNSVKLHLGERAEDGAWRRVLDRAELTRLGEGLGETGVISDEALGRTASAIAGMVGEARLNGALAIVAVGTAGLRNAENRDDVVDALRTRAGVTVDVITGDEETRLAYLAASAGLGLGEGFVAVFDTGGGSTEFTFGDNGEIDERFSVDVGAVPYTERFGLDGAVTPEVLADALAAIADDLSRLDDPDPVDALVAMGGTVTNMAAVKHGLAEYDPDVIQGTVLDSAEIDRQIELYRSRDADDRRSIVGLQPKRADVILAGAGIVRTIMDKLGVDTLTVSDHGLRHGVLTDRFGA